MVPLQQFLADHVAGEIEDYNIKIEQTQSDGEAQIRLSGSAWPWWRKPLPGPDEREEFSIELRDIVRSEWPLVTPCRVSDLLIWTSGHALRELGPWLVIYGASPIPDPVRFFVEFHDVCVSLGAVQPATAYLRRPTFKEFESAVSQTSYLLVDAPEEIISGARQLLDRRTIDYSCLPGRKPHKHYGNLIEVVIDKAWVVCREALIAVTP